MTRSSIAELECGEGEGDLGSVHDEEAIAVGWVQTRAVDKEEGQRKRRGGKALTIIPVV